MNLKKQIISVFILSLFFLLSYIFLFSQFIIYPTVIPMYSGGNTIIFADWAAVLGANICRELGHDVYLKNPCDPWGRTHVYGDILLYFHYVEKFKNFYYFVLPAIINYIFVVAVLSSFRFKTFKTYFTTTIILFSFPVILALERGQFDIVIFILMVLIAYFKNKVFNFIILVFVTISKFYPIVLGIILFFEKNLKKIFINLLIFLITISLIFFIQSDQMIKIFENRGQSAGFGVYEFSLIGTIKFFKNSIFLVNGTNYSIFIFVLFLLIPSAIFFVRITKYFFKESISNNINYNFFEDRLYIFSSVIILFCYFAFSNFVYREIFFIGLLPWILKTKESNLDQKFFSIYYYLIISKFLFSTPITFIYMNKIVKNINPVISIFKYTIDLYLISFVAAIFLAFFIRLLDFQKNKIS